jgi:L-threonylcarbamoyladenylate synthase
MSGIRIFKPTSVNLARLAVRLRRGELVGVPSETVYGLAADAFNPNACRKIFAAKGRPQTDPLIVHIDHIKSLSRVCIPNKNAFALAEAFWPGPLTLILPKQSVIPLLITAGKDTVAVRVPNHQCFRDLIRITGQPLAAPSANQFGYISPTSAHHVRDGFTKSDLSAVLDGGECAIGLESTIVDLTCPAAPRLLRPGGLPSDQIESVLGHKLFIPATSTVDENTSAPAPGMLSQHYSPHTPLILHDKLDLFSTEQLPDSEVFLLLRKPSATEIKHLRLRTIARLRWLSETGNLEEIARRLFSTLRSLDQEGWSKIHTVKVPGRDGLAPAINDRLTRASAKRS